MSRAAKLSGFNLLPSDLTSLRYKAEIQALYRSHIFRQFNPEDCVKSLRSEADVNRYNKLVRALKKEDFTQYTKLHNLPMSGIGPAEVVLFLLTTNGHLGGGSSAGVDLVMGSDKFEVKAVKWKSKAKRDYVSDFRLGGNIPGMTQLEADMQLAFFDMGITPSKGTVEISGSKFKEMQKQDPDTYDQFQDRYRDLAYKYYFKSRKVIFIITDKTDTKFGEIVAFKEVKRDDIEMERYTSRSIKPLVKVR